MRRAVCLAVPLALLGPPARADGPQLLSLRAQRVGDVTYFEARFKAPADLAVLRYDERQKDNPQVLAGLPRLVPQDAKADAVVLDFSLPLHDNDLQELTFLGRARGGGAAAFLLLWPTDKARPERAGLLPPPAQWAEEAVRLDLDRATTPTRPGRRRSGEAVPDRNDLEGRWALARARHFAVREALTPDAGVFGFARTAVGRLYRVPAEPLAAARVDPGALAEQRRLYEMTTGATALSESLAVRRLLGAQPERPSARVVDVSRLPAVDVAEHPWERMLKGRRPAHEPLARLVPHDNWYATFASVQALQGAAELLDQWGGNLLGGFELVGRDYRLRRRYERQLCLPIADLAKALGPDVVRAVALTGNDLYFREGSDVTALFHVKDRGAFLAFGDGQIERARAEHGDALREGQARYRGVDVQSFVTPDRTVSLYRVAVDDFVIQSNSPAALKRVLDAHTGAGLSLAGSRDFQYMRTVFEFGAREEDGFAFFSDAFIRQMVGPASKIKEKRRLEAQASLALVNHAALFVAADSGKLPRDHADLLARSGLRAAEVYAPEGERLGWDAARGEAVSDAYGCLRFATPLVELPIDKVTRREAADYENFRRDYLRLWRRFFDPVGLRLGLGEKQTRLEAYILPLIQSDEYTQLRAWTAGGTAKLDLGAIPATTLLQAFFHLNPDKQGDFVTPAVKPAFGDFALLRFEDGPQYADLLKALARRAQQGVEGPPAWEELRALLQLPVVFGVEVGDQKEFDAMLQQAHGLLQLVDQQVPEGDFMRYKDVVISQTRFSAKGQLAAAANAPDTPEGKRFRPELYSCQVGKVWYLSFRAEPLRALIDRAAEKRRGKPEGPDVNASVYVSPAAAVQAAPALRAYLEWRVQGQALASAHLWEALYAGGLAEATRADAAGPAALRAFGFVPVSPDGSPFRFDRRRGEAVNLRHGSPARPEPHTGLDETGGPGRLWAALRAVRADLRFREDGIHTTLTFERKK
jgi:hypothetical protein